MKQFKSPDEAAKEEFIQWAIALIVLFVIFIAAWIITSLTASAQPIPKGFPGPVTNGSGFNMTNSVILDPDRVLIIGPNKEIKPKAQPTNTAHIAETFQLTTNWIYLRPGYDLGLRSDGLVVWRTNDARGFVNAPGIVQIITSEKTATITPFTDNLWTNTPKLNSTEKL